MADQFSPNIYSKGLWNLFYPGIESMANQWNTQVGTTGYGMPQAPTMPSMTGVLSGLGYGIPNYTVSGYNVPSYNVPSYNIPQQWNVPSYDVSGYNVPSYNTYGYGVPSTTSLMPTTDWWNNISPDIKAGAWAPIAEGQRNLMETLGASGQGGSARAGYSGATGAALGQYMADVTPQYAMNLWNMTSPGAMAGWQAQLGANQYTAANQNQLAQWMANQQLGQNQYLSGLTNERAQWLANQQLGANQWATQAQLGANQWLAQGQLGANQFGAQGELGANQWLAQQRTLEDQWRAQAQLQQNQQGYQNTLAERTQNYQNEMARLNQNYSAAMQGWQLPWQMALNYNNLAPSGAYHADSGGTLGSIMGSATSLLAPIGMGWAIGGFQNPFMGMGQSAPSASSSFLPQYGGLGSLGGTLFGQNYNYNPFLGYNS